ncbi:hypothetical protein ACHAXS_008533 [Conticribra weissflogii]
MPKIRKRSRTQPLVPPPQNSQLRSRKKARQVTTLFHKYTQQLDQIRASAAASSSISSENSVNQNHVDRDVKAEIQSLENKLEEIGGREEYQRASQMNTTLFSTSKWVLGILGRWGWLDGLAVNSSIDPPDENATADSFDACPGRKQNENQRTQPAIRSKKRKPRRRDVRLLEIGAINTQLLDAAARTRTRKEETEGSSKIITDRVHRLQVHAIDIRSTDPRIHQMDFFDLPLPNVKKCLDIDTSSTSTTDKPPYDCIVNSMVINCVTTPSQRGRMLSLCYHQLRPGGVFFLILPKLCLTQSKYMSRQYLEELLREGVGFEIVDEGKKESPKLAFFVLRRPLDDDDNIGGASLRRWNDKFAKIPVLFRGKKFRNTFAVTLDKDFVLVK